MKILAFLLTALLAAAVTLALSLCAVLDELDDW